MATQNANRDAHTALPTTTDIKNPQNRRPTLPLGLGSAPGKIMNGMYAAAQLDGPSPGMYEHGIQVIDGDKQFNANISKYLQQERIIPAGFNYHLISVFGSQSTGKSTLLNYLFKTHFGVMQQNDRRQTTKGIWLSKNKRTDADRAAHSGMADNIMVMDVEGTDGRERGEDQDFERKSALFALATSEILIVNIWEHQVGLYNGANMGLLKTVFEVNLQLFLNDSKSIPRSLLFFVIRDHIGSTPLENLKATLMADLERIWDSLSKPKGLEKSKIQDYFDFAFSALPHKLLQPDKFESEVEKLSGRFREGYKDPKKQGLLNESEQPLFLPEYHRRIPADGFPAYAQGIWDQIDNNKDLDLPTQQELLAQFRCDEIAREALLAFDEKIVPLEKQQASDIKAGLFSVIADLGKSMALARSSVFTDFETEASRYHKPVYERKRAELGENVDKRLKDLFHNQIQAVHKSGITDFSDSVVAAVKSGQKKGANYDFAEIVSSEKKNAYKRFETVAAATAVEGAGFSDYAADFALFKKELDQVSAQLRKEEMRRLATRVERWVKSKLGDSISLEFNKLGSGRGGSGAPESGDNYSVGGEKEIWDTTWTIFTETVQDAQGRFTDRARSYDASPDEVEIGLWRLRRKSWGVLRTKIEEETAEGNLSMKLRENFEDRFRYDDHGVPRIWRPSDDIDGLFAKARDHTLTLIPLLSRFKLSETSSPPPLDAWIGNAPASVTTADEEDLTPIAGVDEEEGKALEEEMLMLSDVKKAELERRFRKIADGVYVEAKRGALGGVTSTPLWMWALLLVLGQNEIFAVARNPLLIILILIIGAGMYTTYRLNLWGPILQMSSAAYGQALEIFKVKLREFLETSETGRQAVAMSGQKERVGEAIGMQTLDAGGKRAKVEAEEDDDEI
ncbi:Root hair defective 3 GTP-binding protein [Venturia nashicola]|uniref:Root hair defective 3 GTP-binding protein n=1 Tax=Venturia nashicola TaxID=86259 RepID=A0A4Z1NUZ3_9PEZI|nr:Root hair defective 3 GTP-binding protein [Venturia nashicola]TLD31756.1 Root hair defective 3 GTP-binding protein [Venturia nashicola]